MEQIRIHYWVKNYFENYFRENQLIDIVTGMKVKDLISGLNLIYSVKRFGHREDYASAIRLAEANGKKRQEGIDELDRDLELEEILTPNTEYRVYPESSLEFGLPNKWHKLIREKLEEKRGEEHFRFENERFL